MKIFWLFFLVLALVGSGTAAAQTKDPERMEYHGGHYAVTGQYVPLYLTADTTVAAQHASRGETLPVRALGNSWALVRKGGKSYYVDKRYLNLPSTLATPDSMVVPRDPVTGLISYVGDVDVSAATQAELMGRTRLWFATAFRAKDVFQVQDPTTGTLVGKAFSEIFIHAPEPLNHRVDYTIQVSCREGHYHYAISNFAFGAYLMPIGNGLGSPAELLAFQTKANGQQRVLILKYKAELYRVARDLQSQLRSALSKPAGS